MAIPKTTEQLKKTARLHIVVTVTGVVANFIRTGGLHFLPDIGTLWLSFAPRVLERASLL